MRGTAVGSFLFGSVNPHAPHTHIFIQLLRQKARVLPGGAMMEGNYGDTSQTPCSSPNNLDLPLSSCPVVSLHNTHKLQSRNHSGAPPSNGFLTHSPVAAVRALHGEDALGGWTVEAWGERAGRVVAFWHGIPRPFLLFFPSFLWFYGLLTGSRLSSDYERESLADLFQRF